jgi:O-acetyl-ADP-ribose deacetylase (regulator of RNase III)
MYKSPFKYVAPAQRKTQKRNSTTSNTNNMYAHEKNKPNLANSYTFNPDLYSPMVPFMDPIPLPQAAYSRTWSKSGVFELSGDLLESDCDVVIHCCNCLHTMGAGIARSIRERWPEVYDKDKETPYGERQKLGHYSAALTCDDFTVINLYAQFDYGRPEDGRRLDYNALRCGLQRFVDQLQKQNVQPKIGTYYLGCSNAGGDQNVVRKILDEVFADMPLFLYTDYKYSPSKGNKKYITPMKSPKQTIAISPPPPTSTQNKTPIVVSIKYEDLFGKDVPENDQEVLDKMTSLNIEDKDHEQHNDEDGV